MILPVLIRFVSRYIILFAILIFVFGKITIPSSTKSHFFIIIDNCIIFFTFSVRLFTNDPCRHEYYLHYFFFGGVSLLLLLALSLII